MSVRPGRKPRRPVSHNEAHIIIKYTSYLFFCSCLQHIDRELEAADSFTAFPRLFNLLQFFRLYRGQFSVEKFIFFFIFFTQSIYFGCSLELPQREPTMYVLSKNKEKNVYLCKPYHFNGKWCLTSSKAGHPFLDNASSFHCIV